MDNLRLILLLAGAVVILAIYAWSRFQAAPRKPRSRPLGSARQHADVPDEADIQQELQRMQAAMNSGDDEQTAQPAAAADDTMEPLLVVSVVAEVDRPFTGSALRKAFAKNHLSYGDKAIFHRLVRQRGEDVTVFGVANMFNPGHFGSADLAGFSTPGISLFLQFPAPIDGLEAFDDFVQTAERLAVELGGQLQDRQRNIITHQSLMQQRELLAASRLRRPAPV